MILHAGSLYQKYLILYGEGETPRIITVEDRELQWKIYCETVDVDHEGTNSITLKFQGNTYLFPCMKSNNPMKTLGFSK